MIRTTNMTDVTMITTWQQFTEIVRSRGCTLLKRLDEFPNSVLVTGCQRSGTTMLARIITQSIGMTNYWFGKDDELDAALILSGHVVHAPQGRYCFQTTYLDECYREYYEHKESFKIIWVIRNPYSVAYSLMYNWGLGALERTFNRCATQQLQGIEKTIYRFLGSKCIPLVRQASFLYNAKTMQLFELAGRLGKNRIFVVDYDELVREKDTLLREIYRFISLDYLPEYSERIHSNSLNKKARLSDHEMSVVKDLSEPLYHEAQKLKSFNSIAG